MPSVWRNALYVRSSPAQIVFQASSASGLAYIKELLTNGYILLFGTYVTSWQFTTVLDDPATPTTRPRSEKRSGIGSTGTKALTP